jgi:hypothetical protein
MTFLRRLAAALSGALLLQLTLLGSGTLRAAPVPATGGVHASAVRASAGHAAGAVETHDMSGMTHDGPAMPQGCDMTDGSTDCHQPWAPTSCASVATCSAVVLPAVLVSLPPSVMSGVAELPAPASFSSGPASAPELPPPRA